MIQQFLNRIIQEKTNIKQFIIVSKSLKCYDFTLKKIFFNC